MSIIGYDDFLEAKTHLRNAGGFEPVNLPDFLFGFQRLLVEWAVRQGRAAIFADCGMGKTPMSLAWADQVAMHTGKPVLIVTPLAVGFQFAQEAEKFGFDAAVSRDGSRSARITITNYERLEKFTPSEFGGVVCDESSAIKSFDGVRRAVVTDFLRKMPYRLLGTATAAPNDVIELGTSSEALGFLGYMDMLNRYFRNEQNTSDTKSSVNRQGRLVRAEAGKGWRFKGHSQEAFWRFIASWARAIRKPSDYGFDDTGFNLPALTQREHVIEARTTRPDVLFDMPAVGLQEEREETRRTLAERCEKAAELIADASHGVAWCHLNDESRMLTQLISGAVEVNGSDAVEDKEEKLSAFSRGDIRVLVTKPSIGAWGLNWQHAHRMTYFPSHSYEQFYQAVRRMWRYGQESEVKCDVVLTEGSKRILANLNRKSAQADNMFNQLIEHMNHAIQVDSERHYRREVEVPSWV